MNEPAIYALSSFVLVIKNLVHTTHASEDRTIYEKHLSSAAVILAKLIQHQPIADEVSTMDKLFGNTWIKNDESYIKAYAAWDRFKESLL